MFSRLVPRALVVFAAVSCSAPVLEPIVKEGPEGPTGTWCDRHVTNTNPKTFCQDFDKGQRYDEGWSSVYEPPTEPQLAFGSVDCGDHATDSPSCSLLVRTNQVPTGKPALLQLKEVYSSDTGVRITFDSKIVGYNTSSPNVGLMAVYLDPQPSLNWWLSIDIVQGQLQLTECSGNNGSCSSNINTRQWGGLKLDSAWHTLQLTIRPEPSPQAALSYDGNVALDPEAINPPQSLTKLETIWGANYIEGPVVENLFLRSDNIRIEPL